MSAPLRQIVGDDASQSITGTDRYWHVLECGHKLRCWSKQARKVRGKRRCDECLAAQGKAGAT